MDGVLIVNKPSGMTSHDVVSKVRRAFHIKRVGHAGTLDPMATGVLVVLVGHATRIADLLMEGEKEYCATCVFGASTTTEDSTGEVISTADALQITKDAVLSALTRFTGDIMQVPPMVSAVHHEGKRLYQLAREGKEVEREARQVTIYTLELLDFRPGVRPEADLKIICSRGTYIRTICADLGDSLGVGGHMSSLVRTRVGDFTIDMSVSLDDIANGETSALISMDDALSSLPFVDLDEESTCSVLHGNAVPSPLEITSPVVRLRDPRRGLIALARPVERGGVAMLQPEKVFSA